MKRESDHGVRVEREETNEDQLMFHAPPSFLLKIELTYYFDQCYEIKYEIVFILFTNISHFFCNTYSQLYPKIKETVFVCL